eukprot:CAMPEP_0184865946 /NCGR_PEP_ID=MMETSP0580-20130426/19896_1 /TAXON_ID=1118495 /ORGANISM="Dactyliosolen fragilissimus" /LENGTH=320 /DNA_ID=CAMNT_0027365351 /DNA_START=216 /DNA_END=1179 /DNA_ORIENTATION=-
METTPEQATEGMVVVRVLAAVLERLITTNSHVSSGLDSSQITKFHALKAPAIGIHQYLERIHKYASCSSECFILALIYIDRLIQKNNFVLTGLNVHRVVITAVLLAAKFFDDAYYNNAYYAKVGGVLVSEMNGLEVEFLFRINFSLHVTPAVFSKYQAELVSHAIGAGLEEPRIRMPMSSPNLVPSQSNTWKVSQEPIIVPNQDGKTVGLVKNLHTSIAEERHAKQISPSPPPSNNPDARHLLSQHIPAITKLAISTLNSIISSHLIWVPRRNRRQEIYWFIMITVDPKEIFPVTILTQLTTSQIEQFIRGPRTALKSKA